MDCCKILDPGVYVDIILTCTAYLTSLHTQLTPLPTSPKQVWCLRGSFNDHTTQIKAKNYMIVQVILFLSVR